MLQLKLKQLYKKKGVTQHQVSQDLNIRAGTLSGLANNNRISWDIEILEKLIRYFDIKDMNDLIEYVSYYDYIKQLESIPRQQIEEEFKDVFEDYYGKGKKNKEDHD
ncbi:helix-turn-helix transcriptional regulator [Peribacillus frigoritolerans]|uniref:helix-turn-helix domain-containing protein n=1 Tax=Peribacillus frigoritolerans TaxID=450367 RepID=UPI003D265E61